jgi:hypothetical protein
VEKRALRSRKIGSFKMKQRATDAYSVAEIRRKPRPELY